VITPDGYHVGDDALTWTTTRSGGPGGQHANTSDTAVTVTLRVEDAGLPDVICRRVVAAHGAVMTARSSDTRSQWRNRQLAMERIAARIDAAARPRATRHATKPSRSAKAERLGDKRRRGETKRLRQRPDAHDD
jgi:ribosome-associated protein